MKTADSLNPLRNPVLPGEQIIAGGRNYWADTNMTGRWQVYEILMSGDRVDVRRQVADNIESQAALCRWFQEREGC